MWNWELPRDKIISTGNETDLAGANVTMAAQKKIEQEQEGCVYCLYYCFTSRLLCYWNQWNAFNFYLN